MDRATILWLICDGKPGHEHQSLGLAEAIARRAPAEIHRIPLTPSRNPIRVLASARAVAKSLPKPDLILAAGHATHWPLLWLSRGHRAKSIVLMKPSLPLACFDWCIAPEHDFPNRCTRRNVILTRGAINRVTPGDGDRRRRLILIGGPSKTHGWDETALLDRLRKITDGDASFQLTDSRRTPEGFLDRIRSAMPQINAISHTRTPPDWVPQTLSQADEVWVTEDSVSMIHEALGSGAKVGLLPIPRRAANSRVLRGIDALVNDGYLTPFGHWLEHGSLIPPLHALREADRCAQMIVRS